MTARDDVSGHLATRALVAAARRGDRAAQAEIFESYKRQVARQIQRMTGDPAIVDDLVQEVFVAAFSALAGFRGDARLQTWLHSITVNKVRNHWNSDRRRRAREARAAREPGPAGELPDERMEADEHVDRLYRALADLPAPLREAFTLRALERMSLKQASAALGVPISTVSYRTRRAEKLLCQALDIPWEDES